jgi:prepilin-type N-terminal cleavage/methylation domain-containing protein
MKKTHFRSLVRSSRSSAGFSLVEMIGVLAIIAILAVIIVPKVFSTIASSRITNAVASVNSMKTAVTEFAGKYGTLPITNANSRIDDLLFDAGMLDGRFVVKIGRQPGNPPVAGATWTNSSGAWTAAGGSNQSQQSRVVCLTSNTNAPSTAGGRNFQLDGTTNVPAGSRVIAVAIDNLTGNEARELSLRIDGEMFTEADGSTADNAGKVVYGAPSGAGITDAYIYIAHQ